MIALSKNLLVVGAFVMVLSDCTNVLASGHPGGALCNGHHSCNVSKGTTIPTCKGPHKGPNGVMIQCK